MSDDDDPPVTDFGSAFNWCDRTCERCPQRMRCTLAKMTSEEELAAIPDPNDEPAEPEPVDLEGIHRSMDTLIAMLEEEVGERPGAPSLAGPRMAQLGREIGMALYKHPSERITQLAMRLMAKTARLSYVFEREEIDDDTWLADTAPNLLLVERVVKELDAELAALPEEDPLRRLREPLARLWAIYEPYEHHLAHPRELLAAWIARGEAPSPWLTETLTAAND